MVSPLKVCGVQNPEGRAEKLTDKAHTKGELG